MYQSWEGGLLFFEHDFTLLLTQSPLRSRRRLPPPGRSPMSSEGIKSMANPRGFQRIWWSSIPEPAPEVATRVGSDIAPEWDGGNINYKHGYKQGGGIVS